jgi:5'-3' exonuclease
MEATKTPISTSFNSTNGKQVKASPEKMSNKRPIALIQEAYASEKENSTSDSSSDAYNAKKCKTESRSATKRKVMVTQINETDVEKDEIKSPGIYTKKFQSMKGAHVNESPSRNVNGNNKVREKSPPIDDCIILD